MNPWLYAFLVSLALLLLLVDRKELPVNIYGGIIAGSGLLIQNMYTEAINIWEFHGTDWNLPAWGLFSDRLNVFLVGIGFTMGILFLQYLPKDLHLQFIHAFVWMFFFVLLRYITMIFNLQVLLHFTIPISASMILNMITLAWFKTYFLKKSDVS